MQYRTYSIAPERASVMEERVLRDDDLHDPVLRRFDVIWRERGAEGRLPGAGHIDPAEIADMLAHIMLVDIVRDGDAVRFANRLVGQHHADLFGRATAANHLQGGPDAGPDHLRDVIALALPRYARGRVETAAKGSATFERISYPLATDGHDIDRIVSIVVPRYARPARMAAFFSWF